MRFVRVLMLSWEYPPKIVGGLGRHVTALCDAFRILGVDVTLVANVNEGDEYEERGTLRIRRVREHVPGALSFCESVAQANTLLLQGVLAELERGRSFDIVHAHDWLTAYAARAVKHGLGIPLVATVHATEWGRNGGLYDDRQRHISDVEWWLTFEAWRVICCSEAMRSELIRIFQVPADKLRVIPNGVAVPPQRELDGRWGAIGDPSGSGAPAGAKEILFVGRLVYEKGVDLLLEAFRRVLHVHPDAFLHVAGAGPEEGALQSLAWRLGIAGRVRFHGYISDEARNRLYRSARAAVVPSRYEPFGIVALEAMAFGAPVVAARTGGLAEVVEDRTTGLLFAPGDVEGLAARLVELLSAPALAQSLARRAHERVLERYDWRQIAQRTLAVYREILAEPSGRPRPTPSDRGLGRSADEQVEVYYQRQGV